MTQVLKAFNTNTAGGVAATRTLSAVDAGCWVAALALTAPSAKVPRGNAPGAWGARSLEPSNWPSFAAWALLCCSACAADDREDPRGGDSGWPECFPTYGDQCSCEPRCMTAKELAEAGEDLACDLGCLAPNDWACVRAGGQCRLAQW